MDLGLLDRTSVPVELAEATVHVRGTAARKFSTRFYKGDAKHFSAGPLCASNWGYCVTHAELTRKSDSILARGQMVISVTLRSRCFSDLAVPERRAPSLTSRPNRRCSAIFGFRAFERC